MQTRLLPTRRFFCSGLALLAGYNLWAPQVIAQQRPEWAAWRPSPHFSSRKGGDISAVIIHYTAGGSLESTVSWFRNPEAKVSAHFVVGRDGSTIQMVDLDNAAWHAGKSELANKSGVNQFSIGIEVCNWGKLRKEADRTLTYTGKLYEGLPPFLDKQGQYWEPFTSEQYLAIARICNAAISQYPIRHITGHSDISVPVGRKIDPGSAFDWAQLRTHIDSDYAAQFGTIERANS